ncbi:SPOR domain-containing protein [Qipengyuania qiaonensis]|uniref:SPOR domain-containing protein n=1 Tax=Qipengyuania qiaonensis TaxID=2867240 RepID=A0ABS7JDW1_9SPHN|nr:SPOR domain-containing protein [Qipengyuania qiaonensis]MBX7483162.1 SPOR domain-containing protein [Qipengyuania qiaonensis]
MAGIAAAAIGFSTSALADVKAGVDAWTQGDFANAVREWADPAAAGDPDAQFNMAQAYRLGRGVYADLAQAEALYAKAAAQGHVKAADNYGLLLFQRGARQEAMPFVSAAALRGDPRAQYLLGIAHFNGDLVEKDWGRAYALLTLANSTGLPQARGALVQMDEYISLEDRQEAQTLAATLKADADAARARELAAIDLALGVGATRDSSEPSAFLAAGADYTVPTPRPEVVASRNYEMPTRQAVVATSSPAATPALPVSGAKPSGPWKVQLGAFGVPGNAERLWGRLSGRSEIAGYERLLVKSANLTVLSAGGYSTRGEADAACTSLKRSGLDCLVTR